MRMALFRRPSRPGASSGAITTCCSTAGHAAPFQGAVVVYEGILRGAEIALERPRPYGITSGGWAAGPAPAEAFWRETLGLHRRHAARRWRGRPAGAPSPEGEYAEELLRLSPELHRLSSLARGHQLTLNTLVQGAWALLLSRYSGEDDVLFGATVSGRSAPLPGIEAMLGLFINTLPVRVRSAPTPRPWRGSASAGAAGRALQYEHTPLVDVQGWSDVPRGHAALREPPRVRELPGRSLARQHGERQHRQCPPLGSRTIRCRSWWRPARVVASVSYDRRRFDDAAIRERLRGTCRSCSRGSRATPGARRRARRLLTAAEGRQLDGNDTRRAHDERCVHELFEAQAEGTPDAPAVLFEGRRSPTRAERPREPARPCAPGARACRPDTLVGGPRGALARDGRRALGILKAGGAYVPLDPAYPTARRASCSAEAGCPSS